MPLHACSLVLGGVESRADQDERLLGLGLRILEEMERALEEIEVARVAARPEVCGGFVREDADVFAAEGAPKRGQRAVGTIEISSDAHVLSMGGDVETCVLDAIQVAILAREGVL